MIELSNLTEQTLQPGQSLTFDKVVHHKGCGECFTSQVPTSAKLRANGGFYNIEFSGNIAATAANDALQLALAIAGTPASALVETTMKSTPETANAFNNVATGTYVTNSCSDLNRISVTNTGTVPVIVDANANLRIYRRS